MKKTVIQIPYTTAEDWHNPEWVKWLTDGTAFKELGQEAFYNVVAQYAMCDSDTELLCTLKEAGLE